MRSTSPDISTSFEFRVGELGSKDGESVRVKGGRSRRSEPLMRTASPLRLRARGQAKPCAACPRARPVARTAPLWGGVRGGELLAPIATTVSETCRDYHSFFKRAIFR